MTFFLRILAVFMVLTLATTIMTDLFQAEFGDVNYWQKRGPFFLIFITLFPRLTLLFSSVVSGGFLWWLALIFCPRVLVAILATAAYWQTNPILVTISWSVALFGEVFEKWRLTTPVGGKGSRFQFKVYRGMPGGFGNFGASSRETQNSQTIDDKNVFEAEFTKKD